MIQKKISTYTFFFASFLISCINPTETAPISETSAENISSEPPPQAESSSIDQFAQAIDSLQNINYFISGKDSIVSSADPCDFTELFGIRFCFERSFDKTDSGLVAYKQVDSVRKFHVAKNRHPNGPSANIIQLNFADTTSATKWFGKLTECKTFPIIKLKPKTDIWLQGRYVYFIQTYYDPTRHILNQIETEFKRHIE